MRQYHRNEPVVEIGDVDPMSVKAKQARLPLCRTVPGCTRAAGHDEDTGTNHVQADDDGVAEMVWGMGEEDVA